MKIILTALFLYSLILIQAQTSRFPIDTQARWKISEISYSVLDNNEMIEEKYEYYIESDTMINSTYYYKLYKSGVAYYDTPYYFEKVYVAAIRDANDKFYLIRKDQNTEVLLFDYTLKVGDTIRSEIGNGRIINKIETMADGRKQISSIPHICGGCCSTVKLLEGIGHSGGIIEDPPCYHIGYYGHYLNCYETDGELIYQNEMSFVNCGDFFSSISRSTYLTNFSVYPVPATNFLFIEIQNNSDLHTYVNIYDITGLLVITRRIQSVKTEIDISLLKKGMYFARISDQTSYLIKKIVVQ